MREILFRAKTKNNGEWVYGAYCPYDWNICGERKVNPQIIIISDDKRIDGLWCEVIPETVGQYTGLTDKNGKKIFEGDVLLHERTIWCSEKKTSREKQTRVVWFNRCGWEGKIIGGESCSYDLYTSWEGDTFEVIGNIHDDPELRKSVMNK